MSVFPSHPTLLDDFNRADEDPLDNGTWAKQPLETYGMKIVSNQTQAQGNVATPASYWTPTRFATGAVSVKITGFDFGSFGYYIFFCDDLTSTRYRLELTVTRNILTPLVASISSFDLRRLGSWFHPCTGAPSNISLGDEIGLAVNPDRSIEAWYATGGGAFSLIDSVDDAVASGGLAPLNAGFTGFGVNPAGATVANINMDDFRAQGEAPTTASGLHAWDRF